MSVNADNGVCVWRLGVYVTRSERCDFARPVLEVYIFVHGRTNERRKIMPRPKISGDTLGVINEVVAKYSDFSPSELSTDAKVRFVLKRMNELADRPTVVNHRYR